MSQGQPPPVVRLVDLDLSYDLEYFERIIVCKIREKWPRKDALENLAKDC